jgi:hypothetical protein
VGDHANRFVPLHGLLTCASLSRMKFHLRDVAWCAAPLAALSLVLALNSAPIAAQESPTSAEDRFRAAQQTRKHEALAALMSPDVTAVTATGQLLALGAVGQMLIQTAGVEREVSVQTHDDAALVTGLRDATPAVRFLRVWHREDGVWRLALVHETSTVRPSNPQPVPAQRPGPTQWPQGRTRDEQEIFAAQRALNETFAKRDVEAYSKLTASSFIRVATDGRVNTREQFIAIVGDRSGPERQDPNHSDFRLRVFQSVAPLIYFNVGNDLQRVTRVFVREGGVWKQLLTQATVVLQAPG